MPVQTCLPVCIWIGFLLIRDNKRFRSEKEICLIWGCSSVFPNWCRTCDGDYATQMWLLIPDHQFFVQSRSSLPFPTSGAITAWPDTSQIAVCRWTWALMADGGLSNQAHPGSPSCAWVLLKAAEVPTARPANSGSVGTTDRTHPWSI